MTRVYLGGSIAKGLAEKWQQRLILSFKADNVVFFNPRRDNWDEAKISASEQIQWELKHIEKADILVIYFDPTTQSPITLLELGIGMRHQRCIVCCPPGFWQRTNVLETCKYYGVLCVSSFIELTLELGDLIQSKPKNMN